MAKIIAAQIDLNKIDKNKIVSGKNGAKYYDFSVILNDEKDKYDKDVTITQAQTKEERAAKTPKVYIGSGKTVWEGQSTNTQTAAPATQNNNSDDNLPF